MDANPLYRVLDRSDIEASRKSVTCAAWMPYVLPFITWRRLYDSRKRDPCDRNFTGLALIGRSFLCCSRSGRSRGNFSELQPDRGLKRQEALEADTPKSVSGMTSVELPRIEKDFPEFHWPEWKQRCENQLKGYLEALEHRIFLILETCLCH